MNESGFESGLPLAIQDTDQLEDILSKPSVGVIETLEQLSGDIIVLGAGGKMGPSLARMAKRASDAAGISRRIIAVDLFTRKDAEVRLRDAGIETIACDLTQPEQLSGLPDAPNVIFMVGMKFGTAGNAPLTWVLNACLPGDVARKYRNSRIVVFSTGNIYGFSPVSKGGSVETDEPNPIGEYAMSALARERVFEYFSRSLGVPVSIIRLNYANELRYGVLVDIAQRIFRGEPVDLAMGYVNVIWQGDAVAMSLQSLSHAAVPPFIVNVTGPEVLSVRTAGMELAKLLDKHVQFAGTELPDALLSNASRAYSLFGRPQVPLQCMMRWVADWIKRGGESFDKPTHFEVRDGKY